MKYKNIKIKLAMKFLKIEKYLNMRRKRHDYTNIKENNHQ
jgi:hypothetical protein